MSSLFGNGIGFHCPAEKWRRAPHSGHVGMHCAHSGGRPRSFCASFPSPEKARGSSRKVFIDGLSRPSFRLHATCSFAGLRKVSTRRVAKYLPTRASNILCGVRQLCQVKLSHAVSQTGLVAKRDSLTWHICLIQRCRLPVVAGAFVLNRILQQPAQVVAEALAILIGESRGTLGTAPSAPHFLFLMPKK